MVLYGKDNVRKPHITNAIHRHICDTKIKIKIKQKQNKLYKKTKSLKHKKLVGVRLMKYSLTAQYRGLYAKEKSALTNQYLKVSLICLRLMTRSKIEQGSENMNWKVIRLHKVHTRFR